MTTSDRPGWYARTCGACAFRDVPADAKPCSTCETDGIARPSNWAPRQPDPVPVLTQPHPADLALPDEDAVRGDYPMFDGLLAYFPNALAEVAKVSKIGNDQHNPGQPMHWARNKSTDHENKIVRHLVDAGKLDGRGVRHTARLAWRALAMLQEELERDLGLPPSRASRDRPF
jgi:hypothetical protein